MLNIKQLKKHCKKLSDSLIGHFYNLFRANFFSNINKVNSERDELFDQKKLRLILKERN